MQALLTGSRLFFKRGVPFLGWKRIEIYSANGIFLVFMICCNLSGQPPIGGRNTATVGMKNIAP
jgi:hypothetical protein